MAIYTKEEQLRLINQNWHGWKNLKYIANQYEEVCLAAVKNHGIALQYVKDTNSEINPIFETLANDILTEEELLQESL